VLAIGGLKEKTMAAYNAGVKTVLIPHENKKDIPDLDPMAVEGLKLVPCRRISEVLEAALRPSPVKKALSKVCTDADEAIPAYIPAAQPMANTVRLGEQK
jgi:ATP-dependent Lon protease